MVARLLTALVFLITAALVFWQAFVHTVHRGTLAIPDLTGQTVEEASKLAHDAGLTAVLEQPGVYSAEVSPGLVAEHQPRAGFHVKTGSTVALRVSLGSQRTAVPDVRGESLQGGLHGLEREGFRPGRRARVDGLTNADRVLATNPPVGHLTAPDTEIDLLVNVAGNEPMWVMPSLLSRSKTAVRNLCLDHSLRLGQVHEVSYPGLPAELVIRQYPPAGAPLSRNDIITIWVAK
jgi:serine/threonine-protein kinase